MPSNIMMIQSDNQPNNVNNSGHIVQPDATVVGATDPVNYSSGQISPNLNINRDTSLNIATWNIRSDKLVNVIRERKRAGISILGLSETHWKEGGDFDSDICWDKRTDGGFTPQPGTQALDHCDLLRQ